MGVVGAMGNISSVYTKIMAPKVKEMILVVRNVNSLRVKMLLKELKTLAPNTKIIVSATMGILNKCSLILSASNSESAIIYPKHLNYRPMVICDIALPFDVSEEVRTERPNATIIQGGIVQLPKLGQNDKFRISGMPLPFGNTFSCMAETLLMGLDEGEFEGSNGTISTEQVHRILQIAKKHNFELGALKTARSF